MAKTTNAPDVSFLSGLHSAPATVADADEQTPSTVAKAPAALAATRSIEPAQTIPVAEINLDVPVDSDETPIDPQEELRAIAQKLKKLNKPRSLHETVDVFVKIRNTKWGISTRNGNPFDVSNPDFQWDKNKVVRAASWIEIAKLPNQYNLDVRGTNNQLWYTRQPDKDEAGNIVKKYPARPVKGYNDDELPPPQKPGKHWLSELRPDLYSRYERMLASGGSVPLPHMAATVDDLPKVIAIFSLDLEMAERNLASRGVK